MPDKFARYFAAKHPLFKAQKTEQGVWWERSVFYFWWEFMRRHEGYRATCKNGGKGRYSKLYQDFGDVHATDFKTWWRQESRGERLFAEPTIPTTVMEVVPDEVAQLTEAQQGGQLLLVAVPLALRKRFILKKVQQLLKKRHTRGRGQRSLLTSSARYPLAAQFNIESLSVTLRVYDLYKANPHLKLWQIGQEMRLGKQLTEAEIKAPRGRKNPEAVDKKNVLAAAASRKLRIAERLIEGAAAGCFPVSSITT